FGQRSTEDGEVLTEDEDEPAVDRPVSGDDAVAEDLLLGHPEFRGSMGDERIQLDERSRIEQQVEPLASGQLARAVLALDPRVAPPEPGLFPHGRNAVM